MEQKVWEWRPRKSKGVSSAGRRSVGLDSAGFGVMTELHLGGFLEGLGLSDRLERQCIRNT